MFSFFKRGKQKSLKTQELDRKKVSNLKKMGIVILSEEVKPIISNQILAEDGKVIDEEKIEQINNLIGLPITITGFAEDGVTRNIRKIQKNSIVYIYTDKNQKQNVMFIGDSATKCEIGASINNENTAFKILSQDGTKRIVRITENGYQSEKLEKAGDSIYEWKYISDIEKLVITTNYGISNIDGLKSFEKLSESFKDTKGKLLDIISIIKKHQKTKNSHTIRTNIDYETEEEKRIIKIESGKVIEYNIANDSYIFNWNSTKGYILNVNMTVEEKTDTDVETKSKFKQKYAIILSYNKQNGYMHNKQNTSVFKINAVIKTKKDDEKDTFGVLELISKAESKIQEYVGEDNPKDTVLYRKTSKLFIDYDKGSKYTFNSKGDKGEEYSINYSRINGWKVNWTVILPEGEEITNKSMENFIRLSKNIITDNIRK